MQKRKRGELIVIGGAESKSGEMEILRAVVDHAQQRPGSLLIATTATELVNEVADDYTDLFRDLGVDSISVLDVRSTEEADDAQNVRKVEEAALVFFTGGDQARITNRIQGTRVFEALIKAHESGVPIVGTSAGAVAMSESMITSGSAEASFEPHSLEMGSGLALIEDVTIDSHFAQRGRITRLLGAVAQNKDYLGLGIDEDTAIIVAADDTFTVIGSGAVYVVDGRSISYSELDRSRPEGAISLFDVQMHVLSSGDRFNLRERRPSPRKR